MVDTVLIIISIGLAFGIPILLSALFFENKFIPTLIFSSIFIALFVAFQLLDPYFLSVSALLMGILLYITFFGEKK